ncbi:MAG: glycoside hydrolase family 16 protein [Clostridia bacterium]|nr:glycoside hydrolase family 16 protein [Clostridia bacterium]
MKKYEVKDHAPSLLPDGYHFELVWSDEFDGDTLDTSKWDYRLCMMGKRHPAWTDKGVKIENGCAVFGIFEENGEIVSSQLQTGYNFMDQPTEKTTFGKDHLQWQIGKLRESKYLHRYGYYECRCRLQQLPGWWSAFWLQSPIIGASLDPKKTGSEVDVMESFKPGEVKHHNVFTGGYGLDMQHYKVGGDFQVDEKEFHTFGCLWLPDRYIFYVDGVEDGVIDHIVSGTDQFILISTEPRGYRFEDHRPTEEAKAAARMGDTFLVDHVRVFDIKE